MSFRRAVNRADAWRCYCNENGTQIELTGLPRHVFRSEQAFREYMTKGIPELPMLDEQQTKALHGFITRYFDMHAMLFTAFENIRLRR